MGYLSQVIFLHEILYGIMGLTQFDVDCTETLSNI